MDKAEAIKVFVVEDESLIACDIMNSLSHMGYEVTGTATTGPDALKMLDQTPPDLVLMDIILKGEMDGIKTAEQVRARFNIPVIYLTASADDSLVNRAKLTGPFGYIIKPYEDEELHLSIEMALYKHQVEEEIRLSREQYRSLLESAGAIPWDLNVTGKRFNYIGPQVRTILGYAPDELVNFEDFIQLIPKEHSIRVREFYLSAIEGTESSEIEYPITASTGDTVWLRDTGTVSTSVEGKQSHHGFMLDITLRKNAEIQREQNIVELKEALEKIRTLHGMLPICAWCKKIRDDQGYWKQVEIYVEEHSEAEFTHSMCPDCKGKMEGELKGFRKGQMEQ